MKVRVTTWVKQVEVHEVEIADGLDPESEEFGEALFAAQHAEDAPAPVISDMDIEEETIEVLNERGESASEQQQREHDEQAGVGKGRKHRTKGEEGH